MSMREAQAESTLLALRLGALHEPNSERHKPASAVISPGSPLPGSPQSTFDDRVDHGRGRTHLVVAFANAAGLQLARGAARQQEFGMRLALGASGSRLVRQLITESALVGALAGSLALPVTWAMLRMAVTKLTEQLPIEFVLDVSPDSSVFAYVLAISMLAGILFGLAPALASSRAALFSITRGTGTSLPRGRLRHVLIAAQVAVSLTLMIAGGLLVRSASQALNMETGTTPNDRQRESALPGDRRLHRRLQGFPRARPSRPGDSTAWRQRSHQRASAERQRRQTRRVSLNRDAPSPMNMRATLDYTWVQPNYFETLGIPLSRGRGFRALAAQADHDAILSESAAHRLWPGQNPIGQTLRLGTDGQFHNRGELLPDGPTWQVIGRPATPGVSRWMAATLNRYTSHYQATGSRIIRFSFAQTQTRDY